VVVCLALWFGNEWPGNEFGARTRQAMSIASYQIVAVQGLPRPEWDGLNDIRSGQIWRLVTPIFPHAGPVSLHLPLNMAWLWLLGGAVETVRGSWRLAMLVLVSAIASNLAEYYFDFGFGFDLANGLKSDVGLNPNPLFLGMSGVVTALFGFIWMRARLIPRSGFMMPRDMVVWMLIFLLACVAGMFGPIANVAHGVGLLTGMLLGAAPRLWRGA
ncbi:MAG: rhomboid family intramembrane serine protease, partial [Planctomycetota bacterium]|nr:rhomboid family intramembrane serine protease [Planctomycetota bacterium]